MVFPRIVTQPKILLDSLNRLIDQLPPPRTVAQRQSEVFDEVPVRRINVLQPLECSLIGAAFFKDGSLNDYKESFLPFALVRQFSPPSSLATGEYLWSVLRFVILSTTFGSPPPYFDVTVPDFDVGR